MTKPTLVAVSLLAAAICRAEPRPALEIGWGEVDITPPTTKRIPLKGQYYERLADADNPYHSRLKFVALAMRRGGDYVLMGCMDNVTVWQPFVDRVRARVKELVPEIAPEHIYMGCIHTHSAPAIRPSGTPKAEEMERRQPDVWGPNEYSDFALDLVAGAYVQAWKALAPGGVSRAFGTARIGHCRLARYADGSTEMYGDTSRPDFVGMLEGEDDGVGMLFTVDASGRRTGVVLNVACPSQVMEANYQVSSDFAGATREKLKKVYGDDFRMLYQIGAAGCQSPRDLVRRGRTEPDGWHDDMAQLLADRLVKCVTEAKAGPVQTDAVLRHENRAVTVPMRRVTPEQVAAARKELGELQKKWPGDSAWQDFLKTIHANEKNGGPGPYDSKLHPYAVMDVDKAVIKRAAEQDAVKDFTFEMNVTRIGDVAMVTCPFELYLAYGQVIKARSAAEQTFVVTKCGSGGYLPTLASENSVGYSGGINVGKVGHVGGYRFCDAAVECINEMFGRGPMLTQWGEKVTNENCWRGYPRPQMVREGWTNLNGDWDYAVTSATNTPGRPEKWDGKIRVPFPIESTLSGVGRLVKPDELLWYTRKIVCSPKPGERILLHFGGVDFRTMVFIGHDEVTDVPHEGGQNPFTLDITDYVKPGENVLTVCVWDPTEDFVNSRGKQSFKPKGCFYTRVSGIWQTVWMETVPEKYIKSYKVFTDIDKGTVRFEFDKVDGAGEVEVTTDMPKDFECWSPENPKLYNFTAKYGRDVVKGHFGMRKIEKRRDAKGVLRFFLNNKPYFPIGTLDQGWWPDGLLTPPSEEAMEYDVKVLKDCGFNMLRKHIKVEPQQYYAMCDRLGILVIQDLPSGSGSPYDPMKAETVKRYWLERQEMKEMMDDLQPFACIVMWNPYNEGWSQPGEFLTHSMLDFTRRYDRTRLVNGPSGCWDWEGGHLLPRGWKWENRVLTKHRPSGVCEAADTVDMHLYRGPTMFDLSDRRISFLGEFGGLGHPVPGHLWREPKDGKGNWGYGGIEDTKTPEGLEKTYLGLMDRLGELAEKGLGGSVYTQTTDVEIEINGLLTYDRKVLKYNPEVLRKAHAEVIRRALK